MNVTARLTASTLIALVAAACSIPTSSGGDAADVRGSWEFTGAQSAPSLSLVGTLTITAQDGDLVSGTLTWEERDGVGGIRQDGGPVTGRVIGVGDIDFDLLRTGGSRRHFARLSADTMQGTWLQSATGESGTFRAVRDTP